MARYIDPARDERVLQRILATLVTECREGRGLVRGADGTLYLAIWPIAQSLGIYSRTIDRVLRATGVRDLQAPAVVGVGTPVNPETLARALERGGHAVGAVDHLVTAVRAAPLEPQRTAVHTAERALRREIAAFCAGSASCLVLDGDRLRFRTAELDADARTRRAVGQGIRRLRLYHAQSVSGRSGRTLDARRLFTWAHGCGIDVEALAGAIATRQPYDPRAWSQYQAVTNTALCMVSDLLLNPIPGTRPMLVAGPDGVLRLNARFLVTPMLWDRWAPGRSGCPRSPIKLAAALETDGIVYDSYTAMDLDLPGVPFIWSAYAQWLQRTRRYGVRPIAEALAGTLA